LTFACCCPTLDSKKQIVLNKTEKYKLSHYLVFTEEINEKKDRIVFSTRSCKSMLISAGCYLKLKSEDLQELPVELLSKLYNNRILVNKAENELQTIINENKYAIEEDKDLLYEVIQPSANCQLGCYYCGQNHEKKNLDNGIAEKITQRIKKKLLIGGQKRLLMGWFGGEPLLALQGIRSMSEELILFCAERNIAYSAKIVTNGMSLKPSIFKDLVLNRKVEQIEITLDGTAHFHDAHRYTKEGGRSFDIIFQNLLQVLALKEKEELACELSIRCNVDKKNVTGVSALLHLLAEHNLQNKISFYTANIYSWGGNDAHKQSYSKEEFAFLEISWKKEMISLGFSSAFELPKRKKVTCMVVSKSSEMYDAYGNVFNCTETSYADVYKDTAYLLGNVGSKEKITSERHLSGWNDFVLNTPEQLCNNCRMLPVCGGACPKSWEEGHEPCPTNKFNLPQKLALNYKLSKLSIKNKTNKQLEEAI
jgi:uncharacterized protein